MRILPGYGRLFDAYSITADRKEKDDRDRI